MVRSKTQVMSAPIANIIKPMMGPAGGVAFIVATPNTMRRMLKGNMRIQAHMAAKL
jgi:hypothetical protein